MRNILASLVLFVGILYNGFYVYYFISFPPPEGFESMSEFINKNYAGEKVKLNNVIHSDDEDSIRQREVVDAFIKRNKCIEKTRATNTLWVSMFYTIGYSCNNGNFYVRMYLTEDEKQKLKEVENRKTIDKIEGAINDTREKSN